MYAKYCRVDQKKLEVDGFSVHQQAQGERNSRIVQTRGFARHTMRQWCLRAFKDHFRLYDLRHIYATRAAQAAIDAAPPSMWPAGNAPIFAGVLDPEPQVASAAPSLSSDQNAATSNAVADTQPAPTVALAQQDNSDDSRDAWFEEILATLGGALAGGAVAWFLFGAAPQRSYG